MKNSTSSPVTMRVPRAQKPARGMSRTGLWDSSAASGSSSMPRKNHIANGRAKRMGSTPWGRNSFQPGSGAMFQSEPQSSAGEKSAMTLKTTRMPIEITETTMANLKEMAAPAAFSPMKTRYRRM